MGHTRSRIYAVLIVLYTLAGVGFDLAVLGSYFGIKSLTVPAIADVLDRGENSILYLIGFFVVHFSVGALIYLISLDPFRADRPWGLVYFNFFPVTLYLSAIFVPLVVDRNILNPLTMISLFVIAFGLPIAPFILETMLARTLLALGRRFDEKGKNNAAYFCLKNSLRWRPSVHETARRAGLLLMETARYQPARSLLERLEPVAAIQDWDVIRALEKVYSSLGEPLLALRCIQRQRALRPATRGLDQRLLDQCLALEQWHDAIELLESDPALIDIERMNLLQQLHAKIGQFSKAAEWTAKMSEREPAPFVRSTAALGELLKRQPENLDIMIALGRLLQKTNITERMQTGATHLERALQLDPSRLDLHRELAEYYRISLQNPEASQHYHALIEGGDREADTYLGYAEILKADGHEAEAENVFAKMREACPDDWRGYLRGAEIHFINGKLKEAAELLALAEPRTPESGKLAVNMLAKKIEQRAQEQSLKAIQDELAELGGDSRRRLQYVEKLIALDRGDEAVEESDRLIQQDAALLPQVRETIEKGLKKVVHGYRLRDFLSDLLFREGRFDDMIRLYKEMAVESLNPEKTLEEGYRKILLREPNHAATRLALGELFMKTENGAGALEAYDPLVLNNADELPLDVKLQWVEAAFNAGRRTEARDRGMALLSLTQDNLQFRLLVIRILEDCGEYQRAYEVYRETDALFPGDETLRRMKRTVAGNKQRDRMETLVRMEAEGKLTPALHFEKADLHREFDQTHQAITHYQRAADDPELADLAMTKLAICLCDRRLFDLADETLDKMTLTKEIAAKHPELKGMYYWIAETLEVELFKPAALKYFKRLFAVDASFKDVVVRLEKLSAK